MQTKVISEWINYASLQLQRAKNDNNVQGIKHWVNEVAIHAKPTVKDKKAKCEELFNLIHSLKSQSPFYGEAYNLIKTNIHRFHETLNANGLQASYFWIIEVKETLINEDVERLRQASVKFLERVNGK